MTVVNPKVKARRRMKIAAAVLGIVFAIVCRMLPAAYQGPCETVLNICTGG